MDPLLLQIVARLDSNQREFDLLKQDIFAYIHSTAVAAAPVIDTPPVASTTIDQATATDSLAVADQMDQNQLTVPTVGGGGDASTSGSTNTLDQNAQVKPQTENATEQVAGGSNDKAIGEQQQPEQQLADLMNEPSTSTSRKRKLPSAQESSASAGGGVKKRTTVQTSEESSKRKFTCNTVGCGRSFSQDVDLARHERIHLDLNPFVCTWPNCAQTGRHLGNVRRHIREMHFKLPRSVQDKRNPDQYIRVEADQLNRHQS